MSENHRSGKRNIVEINTIAHASSVIHSLRGLSRKQRLYEDNSMSLPVPVLNENANTASTDTIMTSNITIDEAGQIHGSNVLRPSTAGRRREKDSNVCSVYDKKAVTTSVLPPAVDTHMRNDAMEHPCQSPSTHSNHSLNSNPNIHANSRPICSLVEFNQIIESSALAVAMETQQKEAIEYMIQHPEKFQQNVESGDANGAIGSNDEMLSEAEQHKGSEMDEEMTDMEKRMLLLEIMEEKGMIDAENMEMNLSLGIESKAEGKGHELMQAQVPKSGLDDMGSDSDSDSDSDEDASQGQRGQSINANDKTRDSSISVGNSKPDSSQMKIQTSVNIAVTNSIDNVTYKSDSTSSVAASKPKLATVSVDKAVLEVDISKYDAIMEKINKAQSNNHHDGGSDPTRHQTQQKTSNVLFTYNDCTNKNESKITQDSDDDDWNDESDVDSDLEARNHMQGHHQKHTLPINRSMDLDLDMGLEDEGDMFDAKDMAPSIGNSNNKLINKNTKRMNINSNKPLTNRYTKNVTRPHTTIDDDMSSLNQMDEDDDLMSEVVFRPEQGSGKQSKSLTKTGMSAGNAREGKSMSTKPSKATAANTLTSTSLKSKTNLGQSHSNMSVASGLTANTTTGSSNKMNKITSTTTSKAIPNTNNTNVQGNKNVLIKNGRIVVRPNVSKR